MKIAVGSDHAGFRLKTVVVAHLHAKAGVDVIDKGCHSTDRYAAASPPSQGSIAWPF
jgi:ribose 5-phosphate isomerase RpiB